MIVARCEFGGKHAAYRGLYSRWIKEIFDRAVQPDGVYNAISPSRTGSAGVELVFDASTRAVL